jgi:hypothetical protein
MALPSVFTVARFKLFIVSKVHKVIGTRIAYENNISALAATSAVRTSGCCQFVTEK